MFVSNLFDDCWKGYKQVGGKKKGGKMVPNCVPVDETRRDPSELFKPNDSKLDDLHHKFIPSWTMLDHHILEKTYVFVDDDTAEQFIDQVNDFSDTMDHNAVITQDNAEVKLQITTNDVKGLTILDFEFALRADVASKELDGYSKGHPTNAVNEDNCKYGKYFCSTDKKWKCRKGPKKSRMSETVLNPQNRIDDFYAKMKTLQDLELDPQVDPEAVKQRKLDLKREFDKLNEDLRDWFGKGKKGGAGGGGWDRYNTKGERIGKCGDKKPGEGKPKCLSKSKAAALRAKGGKKAIANAVKRKRAKDPQTDRPGTGNKPKNVSNNIKEDWKKSVVGVLAGLLMVGNVTADEAVKDAVSIARKAYAMKDYNLEALEGEAKQELFNILRTINGHPNQSKLWPVIKDVITSPEEELPPLQDNQ